MTRPTLTIALSSVLAAAIDGAGRPGLLATLHPEFGRATRSAEVPARAETPSLPRTEPRVEAELAHAAGLAEVITMPRVIPMPRRGPSRLTDDNQPGHPSGNQPGDRAGEPYDQLDPDPTSAA